MKNIFKLILALILSVSLSVNAYAVPKTQQQAINDLMYGAGASAELATQIVSLSMGGGGYYYGDLLPGTTNSYDLGSSSKTWRSAYLGTNLYFTAASAKIVPGATSLLFRNNADSATNLSVTDAGLFTIERSNLYLPVGNLTFGAASAKIIPGATSLLFRNAADNATNLTIADAGTLASRSTITSGANFVASASSSGLQFTSGADGQFVGTTTSHYWTLNSNGLVRWYVLSGGGISNDSTNGGDITFNKSGTTISLQEGTAASACMGVATPNATTPVAVSTTCAVANSRVFYTRVGAVANMASISTTTAPSGTGFSFASTGASDTLASSVVWMIVKES